MENTSHKKIYILIAVFLLVVSVMISYIIGGAFFRGNMVTKNLKEQKNPAEKLFKAKTTSITGEIIEVQGKILVVKNDKGIVGNVPLADNVKINNYTGKDTDVTQHIQTGRQVTLLLELSGDTYNVVTINYVPKIPPLPTVSAGSSLPPLVASTSGSKKQ